MSIKQDITYLISCAVNGVFADDDKCKNIDFDACFELAKKHDAETIIYPAIKNLKDKNVEAWSSRFFYNCRRNMMFDQERDEITSFLEKNNIWYMPLKGIIFQNLYPHYGMRTMVDNDILFDKNFEEQLDAYMKDRGYHVVPGIKHNEYTKQPLYNFEMHKQLCTDWRNNDIFEYFTNVVNNLQGSANCKKMSNEDFYLFHIHHIENHNQAIGIGLRQLIDTYICIKNLDIDFNYVEDVCKKLDLSSFEKSFRELSVKLFENSESLVILTKEEEKLLDGLFDSATHGTVEQYVGHKLDLIKKDRRLFLVYFFPSVKTMRKRGFSYAKHSIFLPIYWVRMYASKLKNKKLKAYLKAAKKYYTK